MDKIAVFGLAWGFWFAAGWHLRAEWETSKRLDRERQEASDEDWDRMDQEERGAWLTNEERKMRWALEARPPAPR